jgi:hypothetical protein
MEKKGLKLAGWWQVLLPVALFAILAVLVAAQQSGPEYSIEGAWYDMDSPSGLDTFVSNAQRPGVEGTFLCSVPAVPKVPYGNGWLSVALEGHGNWVRIAKNKYAFTAMRPICNQDGMPFGWATFVGTITPISENEYTGTNTYQWYNLDGTPYPRHGTLPLHSHRIEIIYE